jgi:hypothetical protein
MNTPSEATVVPAVDGKEEPEPNLAVTSGKKASGKKTPKAVTRKLAPTKARKAVKKAARKKATKRAAKKLKFPYQRVVKMWKAGKTLETIARAVGRYQPKADDPLRSFRVSLTRFHQRPQNHFLYFHCPLHRGLRVELHAYHGRLLSPPAKRTSHVLSRPDISSATDTNHPVGVRSKLKRPLFVAHDMSGFKS